MNLNSLKIFFKGSKTYFTSSLLFPHGVRKDVSDLYAFVRIADDFVDSQIQDPEKIKMFIKTYKAAKKGKKVKSETIKNFVKLAKKRDFEDEWIDAFLFAMKRDTKKRLYKNMKETKDYMYGSAEVIGLMMAKIMKLEKKSYKYARLLGRSMQYANFIRDIDEDNGFQRQYIPQSEVKKHGLKSLFPQSNKNWKKYFRALVRQEIERYFSWQRTAERGFIYIPKNYLVAVKTASDMYKWTMQKIYREPMIIFRKKVKPSRTRILATACQNFIKINLLSKFNVFIFSYLIT